MQNWNEFAKRKVAFLILIKDLGINWMWTAGIAGNYIKNSGSSRTFLKWNVYYFEYMLHLNKILSEEIKSKYSTRKHKGLI